MTEKCNMTEEQMAPDTLEALKGSIVKWERVIAKGTDGTNWMDCPLCLLFWEKSCFGCPVRDRTGMRTCEGSPFETYSDARERVTGEGETHDDHIGEHPDIVAAARMELDFLKSLLPKEAT